MEIVGSLALGAHSGGATPSLGGPGERALAVDGMGFLKANGLSLATSCTWVLPLAILARAVTIAASRVHKHPGEIRCTFSSGSSVAPTRT